MLGFSPVLFTHITVLVVAHIRVLVFRLNFVDNPVDAAGHIHVPFCLVVFAYFHVCLFIQHGLRPKSRPLA